MSQLEREHGFSFGSEEEKQMHFDLGDKKIQNVGEDLKEKFMTHYRGEIEYNVLYAEINNLLDSGKKVPEVEKNIADKYKGIINEYDLSDLLTEVVITRQVGHEKKVYDYEDKENIKAA